MINKSLAVWTFIGIITDISKDDIIVALLEPSTRETVYKKIPRKDINFDFSEYDCVKIIINEYSNDQVNYKIEKQTIFIDEKEKLKIIQNLNLKTITGVII